MSLAEQYQGKGELLSFTLYLSLKTFRQVPYYAVECHKLAWVNASVFPSTQTPVSLTGDAGVVHMSWAEEA